MDKAEQKNGERRVRERLVEPLLRLGLGRPSTMTIARFDEMVEELCQKLAYMSALNLDALAEQVAAHPAGKDRDRLPIANQILVWAGDIDPPPADASPLIRAVFAHAVGQAAMSEGWAPELLHHLRRFRKWPGSYETTKLREEGMTQARRLADIEMRLDRGDDLRGEEMGYRHHRRTALARCEAVASAARGAA